MTGQTTDKRSLAIEAAEAIDPTIASASPAEVANAVDPTFTSRALQLIADYQHGMETAAPRSPTELAALKALLLGQ